MQMCRYELDWPHALRALAVALCALCHTCCTGSDSARYGVEASEVVDGIEFRYVVRKGLCGISGLVGRSGINQDVSGTVVIPERLGGHEVRCVWRKAFSSCGGIEAVRLPSCLERIGASAFGSCGALRNVFIPGGG